MRILLIKPPLNKNLLAPNNDEPLELEYVAAAAEGHEVDILDMRLEKNLWKKLGNFRPDIEALRILRKYWRSCVPLPFTCTGKSADVTRSSPWFEGKTDPD